MKTTRTFSSAAKPRMTSVALKSRSKRRGAVMVESAIVFPVLAVFLGLLSVQHSVVLKKYDTQQLTRAEGWFYASNSCEAGAQKSFAPPDSNLQDPEEEADTRKNLNVNPQSHISYLGFLPDESEHRKSESVTGQGKTYTVSGKTHVFCNEKDYGGVPIKAFASMMWDLAVSKILKGDRNFDFPDKGEEYQETNAPEATVP
ncbi:MAG: hypothetical protein KBF88_10985 [Polyangiaceae bacterium]|nr:hypothetical protein [Polyangiaceae bacterium]